MVFQRGTYLKKKLITMIGQSQAKKGSQFEYMGPVEACKDCTFFTVCHLNLEKGRIYEIISVRSNKNPCPVHEDEFQTVEVKEPEVAVLVTQPKALEGVSLTYVRDPCYQFQCPNYDPCQPKGLRNQDRVRVEKVESSKPVECQEGRKLKKVILRRIH